MGIYYYVFCLLLLTESLPERVARQLKLSVAHSQFRIFFSNYINNQSVGIADIVNCNS